VPLWSLRCPTRHLPVSLSISRSTHIHRLAHQVQRDRTFPISVACFLPTQLIVSTAWKGSATRSTSVHLPGRTSSADVISLGLFVTGESPCSFDCCNTYRIRCDTSSLDKVVFCAQLLKSADVWLQLPGSRRFDCHIVVWIANHEVVSCPNAVFFFGRELIALRQDILFKI